MTQSSTSLMKAESLTVKHGVVGQSTKGKPPLFLNKSRTYLADDLADACLFGSPAVANRDISKLIGKNWERGHNVTFVLGQVTLTLTNVAQPVAKKSASGFILRRKDGKYYCGPKGRNANSFAEAYYSYKPNPDVATVFKSEAQAVEHVEGILVVLREAVREEDTEQNKRTYQRCLDDGRCDVIAV